MTNDAINRIQSIDTALDLDSHLRDLLMIDFAFDDYDRCIPLDDAAIAAELDELNSHAASNASSMPNAFHTPDATMMRLNAEMLTLLMTLDRTTISTLRLDASLCPMHAIDYAICFDDADADCATLRMIFPNHDT